MYFFFQSKDFVVNRIVERRRRQGSPRLEQGASRSDGNVRQVCSVKISYNMYEHVWLSVNERQRRVRLLKDCYSPERRDQMKGQVAGHVVVSRTGVFGCLTITFALWTCAATPDDCRTGAENIRKCAPGPTWLGSVKTPHRLFTYNIPRMSTYCQFCSSRRTQAPKEALFWSAFCQRLPQSRVISRAWFGFEV